MNFHDLTQILIFYDNWPHSLFKLISFNKDCVHVDWKLVTCVHRALGNQTRSTPTTALQYVHSGMWRTYQIRTCNLSYLFSFAVSYKKPNGGCARTRKMLYSHKVWKLPGTNLWSKWSVFLFFYLTCGANIVAHSHFCLQRLSPKHPLVNVQNG